VWSCVSWYGEILAGGPGVAFGYNICLVISQFAQECRSPLQGNTTAGRAHKRSTGPEVGKSIYDNLSFDGSGKLTVVDSMVGTAGTAHQETAHQGTRGGASIARSPAEPGNEGKLLWGILMENDLTILGDGTIDRSIIIAGSTGDEQLLAPRDLLPGLGGPPYPIALEMQGSNLLQGNVESFLLDAIGPLEVTVANNGEAMNILDLDGNGVAAAFSDGIMAARLNSGLTGDAVTLGAVADNATRADPEAIQAFFEGVKPLLDVDGNGVVGTFSDIVMILRDLTGLRGDAVTSGAVAEDATRTDPAEIEAYIESLQNFTDSEEPEFDDFEIEVSELPGFDLLPEPEEVEPGVFFLGTGPSPEELDLPIPLNEDAADTTNADQLRPGGSLGLNLNGSGLTVGVWDGGWIRDSHQEFGGRVTRGDDAGSFNNHATHVGGTIGATGLDPDARGMANGVNIISYDFNNDLEELAAAASQIDVSNHSYGINAGWSSRFNWGILVLLIPGLGTKTLTTLKTPTSVITALLPKNLTKCLMTIRSC